MAGKKFDIYFNETRRKFFMLVNSIFSKCKFTPDIVKLDLMENKSSLTLYAMESLDVNPHQILLKYIKSWWNAAYRKIFNYNKWESVKFDWSAIFVSYMSTSVHFEIINLF